MSFITWLKSILCDSCDDERRELSKCLEIRQKQSEALESARNKIKSLEWKVGALEKGLKTREKLIEDLKSRLDSLTTWQDEPASSVPDWLLNNGKSYKGRRESREKGKVASVVINPADLYFPRESLIRLVASKGWRSLPHDQKLMAIWAYVIKRVSYRYDAKENWQEPNITNDLRYGDCEDGTILFVTLARIAGIPADKVFNALGNVYTNTGKVAFGHSWPIAKMSDGKWYIFETTIDFVPRSPKLFRGSLYSAEWGAHNWKYDGIIKPDKAYIHKVGKAKLVQI